VFIFIINNAELLQYKQNDFIIVQKIYKALSGVARVFAVWGGLKNCLPLIFSNNFL